MPCWSLTIAHAGGNPKHAGPVPVVTCSRLITGHSERLARSKRVRRGCAAIPEAGRAVDTLRSHRNDQPGLKCFVCSPVARIHHAQRDALPAVPQGVGGGRVYRDELPWGIDRCARSRRIMAGVIAIFRRFPTGFRGRQFRWTRGDKAGVSRVRFAHDHSFALAGEPAKTSKDKQTTSARKTFTPVALLPLCHDAIWPTWLMPCFHF